MAVWRTVVQTEYPGVGGPGYSTFHYRDDADGGLNDALQNATDALNTAYARLTGILGTAVRIGTDGRWVDIADQRIEDTDGWSVTGSVTGNPDPLPNATQLVVSWGTQIASRSGRGRTFLGGWSEAANTAGLPSAPALTAARALGADVVAFNATLGNGAFVVWSPTQGISRDITRSAVRPVWAVLRSRRD